MPPTLEANAIALGVDMDGVIVKKAAAWDIPRRATKMGLPTMPGAKLWLEILDRQPEVQLLGVYTVRPEWLRKGQTKRKVERIGLPNQNVVHTSNDSMEKVRRLLDDADAAYINDRHERVVTRTGRLQIGLVDDSIEKVVEAAIALAEMFPEYEEPLSRFTLLGFDPKQRHQVHGTIRPTGGIHVVSMGGWGESNHALNALKRRAINQLDPTRPKHR